MQLEVSPGSGTTLTMYESIELVATTPNGHAYIDGVFAWEPLAVQVREG
jgi:arabinogalactan endo-1,4-beta-galactosidase